MTAAETGLDWSKAPLVTIVTPSFNQAEYLETALDSVLNQGYPNLEYLVVDGGSTDGSRAILERYQGRLSDWGSEPDHGQADAINKGLRQAKGEIVAWLNSDDAYTAGAIEQAVKSLQANPQVGMVYGNGLMVDSELRLLDPHRYPQLDVVGLLAFEVLLQPATFIRRAVLEDVGYLDDSYDLIMDHNLWVRIASRYPILHIDRTWALERTHAEAKTIARATGFVEEAARLLAWSEAEPSLRPVVTDHRRRIYAGFHVFAARRLIDASFHRQAVGHLVRAASLHPPTVGRYWYKVVQAVFSAIGLESVFMWYRRTRRQIQYRGLKINPLSSLPDDLS